MPFIIYCLVKIVKILEWHGVGGSRWRETHKTSPSFPCWLLVMNTRCDDSSQHRTSDINWCNKHSVKFKPLQILTQPNFWRMTPSLKLCVLLRLLEANYHSRNTILRPTDMIIQSLIWNYTNRKAERTDWGSSKCSHFSGILRLPWKKIAEWLESELQQAWATRRGGSRRLGDKVWAHASTDSWRG